MAWHDELSRAGRNLVARYTMGMDIDHANRMIVPVYRYYAEAATIQSAPPLRAPRLAAKARAPATEAALPSDRDVREALQATEQARVALGWRPFAQGDESP